MQSSTLAMLLAPPLLLLFPTVATANNALTLNPNTNRGGTAQIAITVRGSDWYFAVTAIMAIATAAIIGLSFTKPRSDRLFHYITAAITLVASIAYFTMGANLGWTPIGVEFARTDPKVAGVNRSIFYVRYIDWFITTPLLLMDLLLTAGIPWPTILYTILIDWVMIVTGLVGALVHSRYKWGYFVFGCAAFVWIAYVLAWSARQHAHALGRDVYRTYVICGVWTTFLWALYPIAWGLCEGGNLISPDSEAVFYGILDVLAKPGFGALLLWGHRNIDMASLGLHIRDTPEPHAHNEKTAGPATTGRGGRMGGLMRKRGENGVGNGAGNGAVAAATDADAERGV